MTYRKENLGTFVRFLLPSLKLRDRSQAGVELEERLHRFLLEEFGGYTATGGNVFGYWKSSQGEESYGEHLEYQVSLLDLGKLLALEEHLAQLALRLGEKSVYMCNGDRAWLIYPESIDDK